MSDIALPISENRSLPVLAGTSRPQGSILEQVRSMFAQPAVQKSLPMIGLVAILGLAAMVFMAMSQPPQRSLTGLSDSDKAAVADSLTSAGIAYSIDKGTGALTVSDSDFYQAKMLLAQAGLPKSAPDGDAVISALPMGASRAVEGERLRGAREMDLARTIEAIDAVEGAKVHLAVEQPSVFLRDRSEPAASVMLRLRPGRALSDAQVQAIVHLVASSVPGLAPDGVSVVDQAGRLLSSAGGDPVSEASGKQLAIQQQIENRYAEALEKLLTPLVGAGNFTAEVHADVDFAEVQATRESYPKDTAVVRREEGSWTTDSANGSTEPGGVPGALSNQAPPPADIAAQNSATPPGAGVVAGGAAATGAKTSENYNRSYDIGREVSITKQPVGTVKRLSVAVALKEGSKKLSKTELATLENLVKGAVGFDQARGDMIALSARKFAEIDPEAAGGPSWWEAGWVSMLARNLSALGIVALIVFGIAKPLMKRRAAAAAAPRATASPRIRNEIAAALQQEQRIAASDPNRPVTLDMIEAAPGYSARAELIRNFVRQDPARAALVVRDLIRADMPGDDRNG
jgi:flagellar M-ring protein FliF